MFKSQQEFAFENGITLFLVDWKFN